MKLYKLFTLVLSVMMTSLPLSAAINLDQRIETKVTSSSGTGIYTKEVDSNGEVYLKKFMELPKDAELSFRPVASLIRPLVERDNGKKANSAGRYFGKILIEKKGLSRSEWKKAQEANALEIYIYEWSIDKSSYLRTLFDHPVSNKSDKFDYHEDFAWDSISTKGLWTSQAAKILRSTGRELIDNAPEDVVDFCPNYFELEESGRVAFWIHLLNSIAKRESAFDPLVGNDESNFGGANSNQVVSRGLLQISYDSSKARVYRQSGCAAKNAEALHEFEENITCGIAIFGHWAREDGCISCKNKSGKNLGIARYWSTLRERYEVPCKICSSGVAKVGYKDQIIEEIKSTKTCGR